MIIQSLKCEDLLIFFVLCDKTSTSTLESKLQIVAMWDKSSDNHHQVIFLCGPGLKSSF